MIPGLLQSEAYARAVCSTTGSPPLDRRTGRGPDCAARQDRQRLLRDRPNTAFSFIIEERALPARAPAGSDVTRRAHRPSLACAELRNVELQIMPLVREHHAGLDGPMQLAGDPDNQWFGYSEGQRSGQLISDPKEVSVLQMRYAKTALTGSHPRGLRGPAEANARSAMSTTEAGLVQEQLQRHRATDCVEVALSWHKSSYSSGDGDELRRGRRLPDDGPRPGLQGQPRAPGLAFSPTAWTGLHHARRTRLTAG